MIFTKAINGISNIIGGINDGLMLSGYARTAVELRKLSDKQLAEIGISKRLLEIGATAYPWREEAISQDIPDNLFAFKSSEISIDAPILSPTPKAA